jgi:AraC family transcriptional regulator of adaptative response/methylated-DNA-[protein]-cysteine methyltransferase
MLIQYYPKLFIRISIDLNSFCFGMTVFKDQMKNRALNKTQIATPIGHLIAIGDETFLYSLFFEEEGHELPEAPFCCDSESVPPLLSIREELDRYFRGTLRQFQTPIQTIGSPFQIQVWEALRRIPFGTTRSYAELAMGIQQSRASRAVGRANGTNRIAIVIPCHRVINADGNLGGYSAGLERKRWLLSHEATVSKKQ